METLRVLPGGCHPLWFGVRQLSLWGWRSIGSGDPGGRDGGTEGEIRAEPRPYFGFEMPKLLI